MENTEKIRPECCGPASRCETDILMPQGSVVVDIGTGKEFESGVADWVVSDCIINLSADKSHVFREAFRVLKAGGKLSVSDIMMEHVPLPLSKLAARYCACIGGAISEGEYLDAIQQAGFVDVKVNERISYVAGIMWSAKISATKPA